MTIHNTQALQIDLLINIFSEIQAMRNSIFSLLIEETDLDKESFRNDYQQQVENNKRRLKAQIQNNYGGMETIDNLFENL